MQGGRRGPCCASGSEHCLRSAASEAHRHGGLQRHLHATLRGIDTWPSASVGGGKGEGPSSCSTGQPHCAAPCPPPTARQQQRKRTKGTAPRWRWHPRPLERPPGRMKQGALHCSWALARAHPRRCRWGRQAARPKRRPAPLPACAALEGGLGARCPTLQQHPRHPRWRSQGLRGGGGAVLFPPALALAA